jgi:stage IV sporulation protein B
MKRKVVGRILFLLSIIYTLSLPLTVGAADCSHGQGDGCEARHSTVNSTGSEIKESDRENICGTAEGELLSNEVAEDYAEVGSVKVSSRLWELLFGKEESKERTLSVGGGVFGVKIKQKNVTVTESKSIPLLAPGDKILAINGRRVSTVSEIQNAVEKSGGSSITIRAIHNGSEITLEARPTLVDGEYKLGLSLRDGAVGIGTVTFVDPETGLFGGLGHGICDAESGDIVELHTGDISGVILGGIHKGECGKPGELSGILTGEDKGDLTENCECGVFGVVDNPEAFGGNRMPVGTREELHEGEASIYSTLKNGLTGEYKIEIYGIDRNSDGSKSFRIRVTDPTLIALTGGIVRGMSGSPIIQNGKLVGAVTHVLVANPTEGYGIFIENMLNAAQDQVIPKAA